jgi:tRNA(Ile)-lysidine synthase
MKNLFTKLEQHIKKLLPRKEGVNKPLLLLGLSGGPDSVFLFHFFLYLRAQNLITFAAAHLDHGWRNNSAHDAQFCAQLCTQHNIPFFLGHAKEFENSITSNGSLEELGRKIRRAFFKKITEEQNYDAIALAHHTQDQEETFFLRLFRGSSLTGLCGIKTTAKNYIHPLLQTSKKEILKYLNNNNITYCTDPTNNSHDFLRNKIRHIIIPAFEETDARFHQKLATTMQHLYAEEQFLQKLTTQTFTQIFTTKELIKGNKKLFLALDQTLQNRLLLQLLEQNNVPFTPSHAFLQEILRFLKTIKGGRHELNEVWSLIKQRNFFWILKK